MRRILFCLCIATIAACGAGPFQPCPMFDCANNTTLVVTDSAGNPLNDVSGVVEMGTERFLIGCGAAQAPDAGATLADGGQAYFGYVRCSGNRITMSGGNFASAVRAELRSGNLQFNGVVTVTEKPVPVGSGGCSESCPGQEGSVTLQ